MRLKSPNSTGSQPLAKTKMPLAVLLILGLDDDTPARGARGLAERDDVVPRLPLEGSLDAANTLGLVISPVGPTTICRSLGLLLVE